MHLSEVKCNCFVHPLCWQHIRAAMLLVPRSLDGASMHF